MIPVKSGIALSAQAAEDHRFVHWSRVRLPVYFAVGFERPHYGISALIMAFGVLFGLIE